MKTASLFELGYLDLLKAIFFGKKIRLVPDTRIVEGARGTVAHRNHDRTGAGTGAGYDFMTNPDPDWNPGKMWLDPYHVNPFTPNPFDRF